MHMFLVGRWAVVGGYVGLWGERRYCICVVGEIDRLFVGLPPGSLNSWLRALRGTRGRMRSRMAFIPEPHDTLPYDLPWSAPSMRAVKIGLLLAMWYSSSIITSLTTKTILSHFPFPITLALVQQAVAAVLSYISWRWERGADPPAASRDRASIVTPIAGVMVLSLVRRTAQRTAHSAAG